MIFIRVFWDICWGIKGPQDLPSSSFFLLLVLLANVVAAVAVVLVETTLANGLPQVVLSLLWLVGYCYGVLLLSGRVARFQQTLTALLGTDTVISIIAFPFMVWMKSTADAAIAYYVVIGLMCWSLIIVGHILRHALSTTHGFGMGLALLYIIGFYALMGLFFPIPS